MQRHPGAAIRVALLGVGHAGRTMHLPALERAGFVVRIACDTDSARLGDLTVPTTPDPDAALAADVDAVVIATPPDTHAELALAALRRRLHVYVEKPFATSVDDARAVADAAQAAGREVQVGFAYRFHPLWVRLLGLRRKGKVRGPLQATGRFDAAPGAGWSHPFLNVGCHHIDLVGALVGSVPSQVEVEADDRLVVRWPDGSTLHGRYGDGPGHDEMQLVMGGRRLRLDRRRGLRLRGAGGVDALPVPALVRTMPAVTQWDRSFELALRAFGQACAGRRPASPGAEEGVAAVRVAEAVLRAQHEQSPQVVT